MKHLSAIELRHILGDSFEHYFKFAVVRNPWARCVSLYHFTRVDAKPSGWRRPRVRPQRRFHDLSFEQWVDRKRRRIEQSSQRKMIDKLADEKGSLEMDFVGRLETIETDFAAVCRRVGLEEEPLPLKNASANYKRDYRDFYTPKLVDIVGEIYGRDIEAFGYDFEGPRPRPKVGPLALPLPVAE